MAEHWRCGGGVAKVTNDSNFGVSLQDHFPSKQSGLPCASFFHSTLHSQSAACLPSLLIICVERQPSTAGSSVSQLVSQLVSVMSESVSQVSWLSDVLFWDERLRRPLPVMCQVLSSQTDANDSGMRWNSVTSRYPPALSCCSASPLTNVD